MTSGDNTEQINQDIAEARKVNEELTIQNNADAVWRPALDLRDRVHDQANLNVGSLDSIYLTDVFVNPLGQREFYMARLRPRKSGELREALRDGPDVDTLDLEMRRTVRDSTSTVVSEETVSLNTKRKGNRWMYEKTKGSTFGSDISFARAELERLTSGNIERVSQKSGKAAEHWFEAKVKK